MNNFFRQPVLVAGLIAFTTTVIIGSAAQVFPEVAQRITVWQVELIESPKPDHTENMVLAIQFCNSE